MEFLVSPYGFPVRGDPIKYNLAISLGSNHLKADCYLIKAKLAQRQNWH